jgi:hypothetical protein
MSNFKLVNPSIEGTLTTSYSNTNPHKAASSAWDNMSKYFSNNVPNFAFTLQNTDNNKLHHYQVNESLVGGNSAKWEISEMNLNLNSKTEKQFTDKISEFKMTGGKSRTKHHRRHGRKHREPKVGVDTADDSSSSSSSSSSSDSDILSALKLYKNKNKYYQPVSYWWYDPSIYNLSSVYIPTFVAPLNPYVEVLTYNYY